MATVARAEIDRFGAIERGLPRPVAVVERPGAARADRNGAGEPDGDGMIHRRQVAFLDVVPGAGLVDVAGEVDAEAVHGVAGPAAAVALQFERLFRTENALVPRAVGMEQKIAFFAEQPEPVADLPGNLHRAVRC